MNGEHHTCDTLIIGAGLAGIAAARTLHQYNRSLLREKDRRSFIVLEAGDKIGGRVQSEILTTPEGKKIIINPGALWFHNDLRPDAQENPLLRHVRECDRLLHDSMAVQYWEAGHLKKYKGNVQSVHAARDAIDKHTGRDTDVESLLRDSHRGISPSVITSLGDLETGAALNETSTKEMRKVVSRNMGDIARSGLGHFVEHYAKEVKPNISLNSPVSLIRWRSEGKKGVEVHTKNGDVYHAKRCIITVSVGVLKSGDITFEPPLPEGYREELSHISMGDFNKVFLAFDSGFDLKVNANTHLDVRTKKGKDIFYLARDNGQQLVTACFGGELARQCDREGGPEAMRKLAIDGLAEIWGDEIRDHIVNAVDAKVTQWGSNPYVRGCYSRADVGHYRVRKTLAEPIGDIIFPAGEAFGARDPRSGDDWSTHMPGAALSGERAANLVIQAMEKESPVLYRRFIHPERGVPTHTLR